MRKLTSLLLALILVFALATAAFATQEGTLTGGSITIDNAVSGQTYNAYQILYIESYNEDSGAYAYKANSKWAKWLGEQTDYIKIDDDGYVTWVGEESDTRAQAFAKLAQVEAAKMTADATADATAEASGTEVKFENLKLGYYLVDTTLGTLCSLDTTNPDVTMTEKNEVPTIEKQVKEGEDWADTSYAAIGDTVEFKTTVHAKKGAQNYVVHDQMENGLTLNQDSITVKVGDTVLTKDTDYTVAFNTKDGCDFEITFKQTYLDTITADTDIVITYSAVLNENAEISTDSNDNKTKLDYGDNSSTEWDETETYTFMFDIIKTNSELNRLSGAKFELYDAQTGGNKIALVSEGNGVYHVATETEKNTENFTSAVIEAGQATVKGLDANTTYWLEEIEAPDGYNKLSGRVEVKIEEANLTTTYTGEGAWSEDMGGVQITNNTGTELPSTGGMGTTIFYIFGSILVLGAAVLLVTKKRMSAEN